MPAEPTHHHALRPSRYPSPAAPTVDPAPMGLLYNDPTLPSYEEVRWSRTERLDHPTFIERLDALMDQYTVS